ncbi:MAG: TIGR03013 family PEP-CTERM/XrtA system glycosyltransferase [Acidobacteriia bacterium]|nr:TIGR03013 family PEP-CTERM/XrtA system glycosyltransferase [Terriglobia bacterium]
MIRLFNVYYPIRTLVLLFGEALIVWTSFLLGAVLVLREDSYYALHNDYGFYKILGVTVLVLLCSHGLDLYDTARLNTKGELYFRLLLLPGILAFILAGIAKIHPDYLLGYGPSTVVRSGSSAIGLLILTVALFGWRLGFTWLVQLPILVERVYVLGTGERAQRLVQGLRQNPEIGVEIANWTGKMEGPITRESMAAHLMEAVQRQKVHRVIVATPDRRGTIPMRELLQLRMQGVKIEEATTYLEKMSGRIEVENLYPSWLVFGEGFRFGSTFVLVRRMLSLIISLVGLILALPLFPLILLAIRLDSKGPVFYSQARVGKAGHVFNVVKFRTMRQDAEAANGPQWAGDNDPRITRVGRFLRSSRLDEIPQLWCVLKGDMAFVGPRPERPEFVEWLSKEIPFYGVRHMVRPGLTGWAQIKYKYGCTIEDAREKLQYDLFYIKNASIGLELLIVFQTVKTVLLRRGAQ